MYQGVDVLMHPPPHLEPAVETWAVLGVAITIDGFVLRTALKDVRRRAAASKVYCAPPSV